MYFSCSLYFCLCYLLLLYGIVFFVSVYYSILLKLLKCKSMNTLLPLVSVVIPVYNVESYIEACILSVINQTYVNIEIIVVDDGSDDNSLQIVQQYAFKHPSSIIVVRKEKNEGASLARKAGLDIAKGKYIQYLDGDDTLLPDAISNLVKRAEETDADIVAAAFFFCWPDREKEKSVTFNFSEISGLCYFKEILNSRGYWSMASHFQRRSLFYDYNLEMVPNIYFGEDAIWMTQLLLHNPKVVSLQKPIFNYNINPYSISYRSNISRKRHDDYRAYQVWIEDYVKQYGLWNELDREFNFLHLQTSQVSIQRKRFEKTHLDMKRLAHTLTLYPEFAGMLSRREQRLVKAYCKSAIWGYLKLIYYIRKGKL